MLDDIQKDFASFVRRFVRSYMQTVKSGRFPKRRIKKSVEELIAEVSLTTGVRDATNNSSPVYELLVTHRLGSWWRFGFRRDHDGWKLIEATAPSDDETKPSDLLGAVYSQYFRPFLTHVTDAANAANTI